MIGQVKKVRGDTLEGVGDTRVKAIKGNSDSNSDEQEKREEEPVFQKKIIER